MAESILFFWFLPYLFFREMMFMFFAGRIENLIAKHPFYKWQSVEGTIREFYDVRKSNPKYRSSGTECFAVVEYICNGVFYTSYILRLKEDRPGGKVFLAVNTKQRKMAVRIKSGEYCRETERRDIGNLAGALTIFLLTIFFNILLCVKGVLSPYILLGLFFAMPLVWVGILPLSYRFLQRIWQDAYFFQKQYMDEDGKYKDGSMMNIKLSNKFVFGVLVGMPLVMIALLFVYIHFLW